MSQFEYNDLNKFFVSVGIFLIGLTFSPPVDVLPRELRSIAQSQGYP